MKRILVALLALSIPSFAQTINPNQVRGTAVVQSPTGSQPVSQLNGVLYVNPSSATDLVTQVNTLFTGCSFACEVHIPAGNYTVTSGTILINHATQSLTGDGKDKVRITYAGTNFLDWRYSSSTYDFNASGEVSGFTVTCSNSAAICLSGGSTIGATWKDLNVYGPGGITNASSAGTSQGFVFQNTFDWMERWTLKNINIGGFSQNIHFLAPTGAGTSSYGYGLVDGVWTNQGCGTKGVVADSGADVYNTLGFKYQFNYACSGVTTGSEVFTIGGGLRGQGFNVTGENASANYTFAHILTSGIMNFDGDYNIFGLPTTGGVIVDTPTSGNTIPFFIGPQEGTIYKSAGIPLLVNYDGSGESFVVNPIEVPSFATNQIAARFGYLASTTTSKTAAYDAFAPQSKFCHFTRNASLTEASLVPAWCVDEAGNVTNKGTITLGTSSAISSMKKYSVTITPAVVAAATCSEQQFAATGLTQSEYVTQISNTAALNANGNVTMTARADVFTAGKIDIQFCNVSAAPATPPAGAYVFLAIH